MRVKPHRPTAQESEWNAGMKADFIQTANIRNHNKKDTIVLTGYVLLHAAVVDNSVLKFEQNIC